MESYGLGLVCVFGVLALCMARVSHASGEIADEVIARLERLESKQDESEAEIIRLKKLTLEQSATIQELRTETLTQRHATAHGNIELGQWLKRQTYHERQAFTAYSNRVQHPANGAVILFNEVLTNEGTGYNNVSGVFTCNQDGLYLFTMSVSEVNENNMVWAELVVNGQKKLQTVAETYHLHQDAQGSNLAVLRLKSGDQVWVAAKTVTVLPGDDNHRTNTFTGLFLYN